MSLSEISRSIKTAQNVLIVFIGALGYISVFYSYIHSSSFIIMGRTSHHTMSTPKDPKESSHNPIIQPPLKSLKALKKPRESTATAITITTTTAAPTEEVASKKKKRRYRPGRAAIREIRKYQQSTNFLIPKAPIVRLVREIVSEIKTSDNTMRFTKGALGALQTSSEEYLVKLFEDSMLAAVHRNCVTITVKDMRLARRLRGDTMLY